MEFYSTVKKSIIMKFKVNAWNWKQITLREVTHTGNITMIYFPYFLSFLHISIESLGMCILFGITTMMVCTCLAQWLELLEDVASLE